MVMLHRYNDIFLSDIIGSIWAYDWLKLVKFISSKMKSWVGHCPRFLIHPDILDVTKISSTKYFHAQYFILIEVNLKTL